MVSKTRSPNYPVISLGAALEMAKKLYDYSPRHPVPVNALVEKVWGYKSGSAYANQCIGALRQFGLIKIQGKTDERQITITESAAKIAEDHPHKAELICAAALMPKVHANIWGKYGPFDAATMPKDETLKHFLLFEHDPRFNKGAIDNFLAEFKETIEYSKVGISIDLSEDGDQNEGDGGNGNGGQLENPPPPPLDPRHIRSRERRPNMQQATMPLAEGDATLEWPSNLSPESFEDFEAWVQLMLRRAKRSIKNSSDENSGGGDPI